MDMRSVPQVAVEHGPELVRCFRHEDVGCPRCDGTGYRPRRRCAECEALAGRPSEGEKALLGRAGVRDRKQPVWCMDCHPELGGGGDVLGGTVGL